MHQIDHKTMKDYKPSQKLANNQLFKKVDFLSSRLSNPKRIIFDKLGTGLKNQPSHRLNFVFAGHPGGIRYVCSLLSGSKLNTEENSVFMFI